MNSLTLLTGCDDLAVIGTISNSVGADNIPITLIDQRHPPYHSYFNQSRFFSTFRTVWKSAVELMLIPLPKWSSSKTPSDLKAIGIYPALSNVKRAFAINAMLVKLNGQATRCYKLLF